MKIIFEIFICYSMRTFRIFLLQKYCGIHVYLAFNNATMKKEMRKLYLEYNNQYSVYFYCISLSKA